MKTSRAGVGKGLDAWSCRLRARSSTSQPRSPAPTPRFISRSRWPQPNHGPGAPLPLQSGLMTVDIARPSDLADALEIQDALEAFAAGRAALRGVSTLGWSGPLTWVVQVKGGLYAVMMHGPGWSGVEARA